MTHPTTDLLYEALGPAITRLDPQGLLLRLLDGPGSLLGEVDDVVRDSPTAPGWAAELTSQGSHRIRWTGQFLGVRVPDGATDPQARTLVQERPATRRGTVGALVSAAQATLTGSLYVGVRERDGSPYRLTVTTYTEQTPDPAATDRALQEAKPAGLVLTHMVVDATSYDAVEDMAALSYTDLEAQPAQTYTDYETGA